jgi:hypothetical protein
MEFRIHIGFNIHKSGYLNANPDPTGQFNGFAGLSKSWITFLLGRGSAHGRKVFLYIFWRARVCWPLLCLCYVFLRDIWIRTQVEKLATTTSIRFTYLFFFSISFLLDPAPGESNQCGSMRIRIRNIEKQMAKIVATQLLTVATQLLAIATQL